MAEMQSNRNDDVFGRTDKQFGIPSIDSLALKYSKAQLQQMAQMGRIPPIYAVMAGMAQDRIQLNNSHAPETTVAQDTFGQHVTDSSGQGVTDSSGSAVGTGVPGNGGREMPGGSIQEIKARTHGAEMGWDPRNSAAAISKAHGGLMSIPRPGEKYNQDNFATGGIVAFDEGGRVKKEYLTRDPIDAELAEFQAEVEQARGANTRPMFEQQNYRMNQGPSGGLPQIMSSPEAAAPPAVTAPLAVVKARETIAEKQPGPLAAMAQQGAPASDEFAQKGMDALKLPKRTPADTTGLVDTPESIAKNKKDLLYRTVGYTGAEMMAGKSPFAMVNIGEALSKGFSAYAQQIGEHKKATKEDIKDLAAIRRAEAALEQGDLKMGVDIITNQLTNDRAREVALMQVKGQLEGEKIRAGSKPLDIAHILMYGSPEEKERARGVVSMMNTGKDKTPQDVRIAASTLLSKNDEYAMLSTSDKPAERARAAKMLSDMEAYILTGGMGGGGGGGKGEVNKSNPLLTGK